MHTGVFVWESVCTVFSEYTLQLVAWRSVSPRYRYLYLSNNHLSALPPGVFSGLSSLQWVCMFPWEWVQSTVLAWRCWIFVSVRMSGYDTWSTQHQMFVEHGENCIFKHQDIRTYMYRLTDRHSGWISEIVAAHTPHSHTLEMRLSCGGHICAHVHVHGCVLISFLFSCWKHCCFYVWLMCLEVSVFCSSAFMSMHDCCQHARARTCRDHSHTLELRWWRVWRWFALALQTISFFRQSYIQTCILGWLTLCFSLYRYLLLSYNQLSALPPGVFAGFSSLRWARVFRGCLQSTVPAWKCWM
jgi:hypothetical protein